MRSIILLFQMKKILPLICSAFFLMSNQFAHAEFSDVSSNFHQSTSINWLQQQGVVEGYSDGSFQPEKPVNRAEFPQNAL